MSDGAPDYVAQVTGWRAWVVEPRGPEARLVSVTRPTVWPVGAPLRADCPLTSILRPHPSEPHGAPPPHPGSTGCQCGIHAARSVALAAFYIELPSRAHDVVAIGRVALWGRVIEGEAGWRASFAYPEHLYLLSRQRSHLERVERLAWELTAYGVPIEILECPYLGATEALAQATPLATGSLPIPIAG